MACLWGDRMGLLKRTAKQACALALVLLVLIAPASALETDQYYGWDRPLADSGAGLNAKINFELRAALAEVNAEDAGRGTECREVIDVIKARYTKFIFQKIELWAARTAVLERIPGTRQEELDYRKNWIYRGIAWYDLGRLAPPSPTLEVAGVRLGTDKLSHFFSEGHFYLDWYETARANGASVAEAEELAVRRGVALEMTVLGGVISGVASPGDLEANYQGLLWFVKLCEGEQPDLVRTEAGWQLREPFDLRPYISPEWDESYAPNVVTPGRWVRVKPAIVAHCAELDVPAVRARREAYAKRDTETFTEKVLAQMIQAGQIDDPANYGIERVCADSPLQHANRAPAGAESSE